jgi:hypothetical protein
MEPLFSMFNQIGMVCFVEGVFVAAYTRGLRPWSIESHDTSLFK